MARTDCLTDYLTDIADAIKEKTGDDTPISACDFDTRIRSISGGETYELPIASEDTLGGVKIGNNITIDEDGTISAEITLPSTNVTSVMYFNNTNQKLVLEEPSTDSSKQISFSTTEKSINYTFDVATDNFVISPLSLYNLYLCLNGLSTLAGKKYMFRSEWKHNTDIISKSSSISLEATTSNELVGIPMPTNLLTSPLALNIGDTLTLTIYYKTNYGDGNVNILSGTDNQSAFVKNGAEVTANNVYDNFNGANHSQSYINHYLKEAIPTGDTIAEIVANNIPSEDITANTDARHTHTNISVLDNITSDKVTEWNNKIAINDTYTEDANSFTTTGYIKTAKDYTANLPSVVTGNNSSWGVLCFVAENKEELTGTQMFYPIDGDYKGRVFVRCLKYMRYDGREVGEWNLLANYSEIPTETQIKALIQTELGTINSQLAELTNVEESE